MHQLNTCCMAACSRFVWCRRDGNSNTHVACTVLTRAIGRKPHVHILFPRTLFPCSRAQGAVPVLAVSMCTCNRHAIAWVLRKPTSNSDTFGEHTTNVVAPNKVKCPSAAPAQLPAARAAPQPPPLLTVRIRCRGTTPLQYTERPCRTPTPHKPRALYQTGGSYAARSAPSQKRDGWCQHPHTHTPRRPSQQPNQAQPCSSRPSQHRRHQQG